MYSAEVESISNWSRETSDVEENPFPKPLRIIKRGPRPRLETVSASSTVSTSSIISSLEADPWHVSVPATTFPRINIGDDTIHGSLRTPLVPQTKRAASRSLSKSGTLTVLKKRRSDTASTISATNSSTTEQDRISESCSADSQLPAQSLQPYSSSETLVYTCSKNKITHGSVRSNSRTLRAVTVGPSSSFDLSKLSLINGHLTTSSLPAPISKDGRRRAASARTSHVSEIASRLERLYGSLKSNKVNGNTILCRQQVLTKQLSKHGLFDRMMSGLTTMSNTGSNLRESDKVRQILHLDPGIKVGDDTRKSEAKVSTRGRTSTASSAETDSSLGSHLEKTLAAFPRPPKSKAKVRFSRAGGSKAPLPKKSSAIFNLSPSEPVSVVRASLCLTPEIDSLVTEHGQSVFVTVEMKGCVDLPMQGGYPIMHTNQLDVVVVVDNSLATSPASLMASCEAIAYITSILDPVKDRLAVTYIHPPNTQLEDIEAIVPMGPPDARKIKKTLDSILGSGRRNDMVTMEHSLSLAAELLLQSKAPAPEKRAQQKTTGHIILLTCDFNNIPLHSLSHDILQIHLICPAILPWRCRKSLITNGWQILPSQTDRVQTLTSGKGLDERELHDEIRTLVSHARAGSSPGRLVDLVLDIKAAPNCSIEGVMGKSEYRVLQPGQRIAAMVKVKLGAIHVVDSSLSTFPREPRTPSGSVDLLKELDALLEQDSVPIMKAKLRYKHSMLPSDTQCSVKADACIKRRARELDMNLRSREWKESDPPQLNDSQTIVQKQLIYHLATHHAPKHALSTFCQEFGEDGSLSICPEYLRLVVEELKYQARILERFEISTSGSSHMTAAQEGAFEHFGQGLFDITNYRPQDWLTIPEEALRPMRLTAEESYQEHLITKEPADEARKIWGELRKKSKGQRELDIANRVTKRGSSEDKLRLIQETALRNKRSVGADTLKSMAYGGRNMGSFAPWL